jgi:hypothetical protein
MKNLRTLNSSVSSRETLKAVKIIKTSKGDVEFTPTFNKGDNVKVLAKHINRDGSLRKLKDLIVLVDYCKVADLGNMVVEVLYLQKSIKEIQNPYLVEHFEKII